MSLTLTPAAMVAAYEYLRVTEPLRRLRLPHSDEIIFAVTHDRNLCGICDMADGGTPRIAISGRLNGHTLTVMATMAHEMIHLWQMRKRRPGAAHGAEFRKIAGRVCRHHGFDPKAFA